MNLLNQLVTHKAFGEGEVTEHSDSYLNITFATGDKRFVFPDSFEMFLKAEDTQINEQISELLKLKTIEKEMKIAEKLIEFDHLNQMKVSKSISKPNKNLPKVHPRANVAFKCNFCDGGQSSEQIGYNGACSDNIINNNIVVEHRTWCNSEDCPCLHYHNGEISRKELDKICSNGGFVCYESQMLRDWKALAGIVQHGDNKGKPMKLNQVQSNSLCVLTTRDPQSSENDRYVFAVFLVDDTYEGDIHDEGYVSTQSEFKIKLSPEESRSMKFWNYHSNDNQSDRAVWSSGLHRYFEDEQAAQILKDITNLKKGTKDEGLSIKLFEHFCQINSIDKDTLAEPFGALKRK